MKKNILAKQIYERRITIWRNRVLDCVAVTKITNRFPNRGTVFHYYWHMVEKGT